MVGFVIVSPELPYYQHILSHSNGFEKEQKEKGLLRMSNSAAPAPFQALGLPLVIFEADDILAVVILP